MSYIPSISQLILTFFLDICPQIMHNSFLGQYIGITVDGKLYREIPYFVEYIPETKTYTLKLIWI